MALFFVGLTLRPHVVGIGPLLPAIRDELSAPYGQLGGLVSIPLLCMGLVAMAAVPASRWFGTRRTVAACLVLTAAFGALRALVDSTALLLLLTAPVGIAVGVAGPLLPVVVKERHPRHLGLATGVYATAMQVGATASVAGAVPLAVLLGGWRWPFGVFSLVGLLSVLVWLGWSGSPAPRRVPPAGDPDRRMWRSADTWLLAWMFFLISLPFFGLNAWLTAAYAEFGWTLERAGILTATVGFAAIPGTLLPGMVARTLRQRCTYLVAVSGLMVVACVGLVLAPDAAWLWALAAGFCQGGCFTVILTLPTDISADTRDVGHVSSIMLTVGYLLAAVAPVLLGLVRDAFEDFRATLWTIAAAVAVLVASAVVARARLVPAAARSAARDGRGDGAA